MHSTSVGLCSLSLFFYDSQLSVEEVRERQQRLSKMRSLLFQHEAKSKRVAKIKSKTFRRLDKSKKMRDFMETDEEAVKEAGLKQEQKRAEVCHVFFSLSIYLLAFLHFLLILIHLDSFETTPLKYNLP